MAKESTQSISKPSSSTILVSDNVGKSKEYKNKQYGFSFAYPDYFHLTETNINNDFRNTKYNFPDTLTINVFPRPIDKVDYFTVVPAVGPDGPFRYSIKDNQWLYVGDSGYYQDLSEYPFSDLLPKKYIFQNGLDVWIGKWNAVNSTQGGNFGEIVFIESPSKTFVVKLETERCKGYACQYSEPGDSTPKLKESQSKAEDIFSILSTFKFTQ